MTVATFSQTNFTSQDSTSYKASIDGDFSVLARAGQAFAPHAAATPSMTVQVDPGYVFDGFTATATALQTSGAITGPVSNPRIDLVTCNISTGAMSVVTGAEAASPVPPAIPLGTFPVAQVALAIGVSAITNSMVTDVRNVITPPERVSARSLSSASSTQQSDLGKAIELSGTFALTLSTVVGSGWWAMLKNTGAGTITLSPQTGTVDGLATLSLQAGQGILIHYDGSGFYSYGLGGSGNPAGTILPSACSSAPAGYLLCNGALISRTTYATLFAAIGTAYGAGDGSTTFGIPDGRGVVLRGLDGGRGLDTGRVLGSYQADAIASHTVAISDPGHSHTATQPVGSGGGAGSAGLSPVVKATGTSTTGITAG